jgi:hypothetical protein
MGPRYYFEVLPAAVILSARGIREAPKAWSLLRDQHINENRASEFLAVVIVVCVLFNAGYFLPSMLREYSVSSDIHQGMTSPVWRHVENWKISNAVVFIKEIPFSLTYGAGLWLNDPELKGDVVYARDCGVSNESLMRQYPGRKFFRYTAESDVFEEIYPPGISAH